VTEPLPSAPENAPEFAPVQALHAVTPVTPRMESETTSAIVRAWRRWWPSVTVALFAFLSSFTSLANGFAYDDGYIVAANERVHSLKYVGQLFLESYWGPNSPAGGYRPLTLVAFAIEWVVGGSRPIVFHAANILFYIAVSLAVLALARRCMPPKAAWIAAALFAVHPVHVEAVGNVVGQSELIVALACAGGVALYVRERSQGRMRWRIALGIIGCFAAAVLAKENGFVFPLLLLAAELTVVADPRPLRARFITARPLVLALTLAGLVYLFGRGLVLGDLAGMPPHVAYVGLHLTNAHRVLTMIGLAKDWARLLLWPAKLAAEYSPPMTPFAVEMSTAQLPGFLVLAGTALLFWFAVKRGWRDISFGIAWVAISMAPISGFFVAAGFILAERTMMLPSIGAMIVVAGIARRLWDAVAPASRERRTFRVAVATLVGLLLFAGAARSAVRQLVWHDNDVLFSQTVIDAPQSYRAHQIFGAWLFARGFRGQGEDQMWQAINLFPYDPIPPYLLAEEYRKKGACNRAIPLYRWSLATTDTAAGFALAPYSRCLMKTGQYDLAKKQALRGIGRGADFPAWRKLLVQIDSAKRATGSAPTTAPISPSATPRRAGGVAGTS
jgi:hypothetical protein